MTERAAKPDDDILTFGWVKQNGRLCPQLRRGMVGSLDVRPLAGTAQRVPAHHAADLDYLVQRYPAPELPEVLP